MLTPEVVASAERFAWAIALMDERALETDVESPPGVPSKWIAYGNNTRTVACSTYQELRELAADLPSERMRSAPLTLAQRILGQHQLAYRDLTGALVPIADDDLDRTPGVGEWSLRTVLEHMLCAEFGFSLVIESAVEQRGAIELKPAQFGEEEAMASSGDARRLGRPRRHPGTVRLGSRHNPAFARRTH